MVTWTRGKRIVSVLTGVIGVASLTATGAVSAVFYASTPTKHPAAARPAQTVQPVAPTQSPAPAPSATEAPATPAPATQAPATQAPAAPAVPAPAPAAPAPAPVQPSQGGGASGTSSGS